HEHLDDVGIVHMNGRLFDPTLGVFMQADPLVQDPFNLQNYNRYGYCYNNPLTCTDPSGFSFLGDLFKPITDAWHGIWRSTVGRAVVVVVAAYFTGGAALDWYASSVAAEAGFAASNAAIASGLVGTEVTAAGVAAESAAYAAAASSFTGGMIAGGAAGFTGSFIASSGNLREGLRGAVVGALSGGIGNWAGGGAISRMVGGGVNGYLQTGRLEGLARGFAAGAVPGDLGVGDTYLSDPYVNVTVGILRDGIKGAVVADSSSGFLSGVAYGQMNNAIGHVVGFTLSGFNAPTFRDGAFEYDRSHLIAQGAITIGNVISGAHGFLYSPLWGGNGELVVDHERAHIPQASIFGALYLPIHGLVLGVSSILPGGDHGPYNFLECSTLWISIPHGGTCH
ncbi:hypothetical protein EXJ73_23540, partial [Pelomonas aquatica]